MIFLWLYAKSEATVKHQLSWLSITSGNGLFQPITTGKQLFLDDIEYYVCYKVVWAWIEPCLLVPDFMSCHVNHHLLVASWLHWLCHSCVSLITKEMWSFCTSWMCEIVNYSELKSHQSDIKACVTFSISGGGVKYLMFQMFFSWREQLHFNIIIKLSKLFFELEITVKYKQIESKANTYLDSYVVSLKRAGVSSVRPIYALVFRPTSSTSASCLKRILTFIAQKVKEGTCLKCNRILKVLFYCSVITFIESKTLYNHLPSFSHSFPRNQQRALHHDEITALRISGFIFFPFCHIVAIRVVIHSHWAVQTMPRQILMCKWILYPLHIIYWSQAFY